MSEQLSIDPKGELKSLINKKVDIFNAITELIDDSIDANSSEIELILCEKEIKCIDNGDGYSTESWNDIDKMKKTKTRGSKALGCFNMGRYICQTAICKELGGEICTLTLPKDKDQVKCHRFTYHLNNNDIEFFSSKESNGDEDDIFSVSVLKKDGINDMTGNVKKKIFKENSGTITIIKKNKNINYGDFDYDFIKRKLELTYFNYLKRGGTIIVNDVKLIGYDRLHYDKIDNSDRKSYNFELFTNNDNGKFYIKYQGNFIDIPKQSSGYKKLEEMINLETEVSTNLVKLSDINIAVCRVTNDVHNSDLKKLEFLKRSERGRLVPYISGIAIFRNGLREMGSVFDVVDFNDDINTEYLKLLRGKIDYSLSDGLSEKDTIQVNTYFGVTSEKDLIAKIDGDLKKLVKCLVYKESNLFQKPQKKRGDSLSPGGYLYLYTLKDTNDWKSEDNTIYRFGQTEREDYKKRIQEHQREFPTKEIQIEGIWNVSNEVKKKELEILGKYQDLGMQYDTPFTSTSEFVKSNDVKKIIDVIENSIPPNSRV